MTRRAAPAIRTADALCGVDADYRIVAWNTAAEQLFGVSASEAIGKPCYEIVSGKDTQGQPICQRGCHPMRLASRGQPVSAMPMDRTGPAGEPQALLCETFTLPSYKSPRVGGPVLFHTFWPNRDRTQLQSLLHRLTDVLQQAGSPVATPSEPSPAAQADSQLTPRETEVLRLLRQGLSTRDIAARIGVSADTARTHVQNLRLKLRARTRLQAVAAAEQRKLL